MKTKVKKLGRNLDPKSQQWLAEINIHTCEEIKTLGAVEVYLRLHKKFNGKISLNMLWALFSGLTERHWTEITLEEKSALIKEVEFYLKGKK